MTRSPRGRGGRTGGREVEGEGGARTNAAAEEAADLNVACISGGLAIRREGDGELEGVSRSAVEVPKLPRIRGPRPRAVRRQGAGLPAAAVQPPRIRRRIRGGAAHSAE